MNRLVTHPLFIRVKKVYESCETLEQCRVAEKYDLLVQQKMVKEHPESRYCWEKSAYCSDLSHFLYDYKREAYKRNNGISSAPKHPKTIRK